MSASARGWMLRAHLVGWYAAFTGATALTPWLAVLLVDRGWTGSEASLLLAALPAGRLFGVPLQAWIADRYGSEPVVRGTVAVSALGVAALAWVTDPWLTWVAILVWALARGPTTPIVDATTIALVGRGYGRIRSAGSLAYLLVVGASGLLRDRWTAGPVLIPAVLSVAALALAFRLPRLAPAPRGDVRAAVRGLALHPVLLPLVGVCVAHGAALSVYDMLFAMHVEALGFGPQVTGAAIALGVVIEVIVLGFGERLLDRIGPLGLLAIGVGATIPRFALTAFASAPWVIAAQALHGLNFGCWWLAATTLFAENAPPGLRHSSQALLPAAAFGAGPLVGLVLGAVVLDVADTRALFAWATLLPVVGLGLVGCIARRPGSTSSP